jgi:hypothetical protein
MRRTTLSLFLAVASLALTACPERVKIADITSDPGRYQNKEVAITGRVTSSHGVLGQGIYEVDDGTGKIWVFTEKYGVPSKGAYVGVAGRVIPGLTFAGRNYFTVLRETKRRTRPKD